MKADIMFCVLFHESIVKIKKGMLDAANLLD
jgi:hypothetical protein